MGDYARLPVRERTHSKARVTKAKHGMTWDEFIDYAAEALDPDMEK